jgi:hypothetical protein
VLLTSCSIIGMEKRMSAAQGVRGLDYTQTAIVTPLLDLLRITSPHVGRIKGKSESRFMKKWWGTRKRSTPR